jgi:hypothetical protein
MCRIVFVDGIRSFYFIVLESKKPRRCRAFFGLVYFLDLVHKHLVEALGEAGGVVELGSRGNDGLIV